MEPEIAPPFASEADRALLAAIEAEQLAMLNDGSYPSDDERDELWAEVRLSLTEETPGLPGEEVSAGLEAASRGLGQAQTTTRERAQIFDQGIRAALETMGRLRSDLDGVVFAMAWEASERGLHTEVGLSLSDWLRVRCPWLPPGDAVKVGQIVNAAGTHWGRPLAEEVAAGRIPLHRASQVARTMLRLAPSLDPDQQEAYASISIAAAGNGSLSDRDLGIVCAKLVQDLLDGKDPGARERAAHQLRSVTSRRLGDGLTRFSIDAPDEHAATLEGLFSSSLAAPEPTPDEADERSAPMRKFDALMKVVDRGLSNPGGAPSTGRSTVILTIPFDPDKGQPSGPGITAAGMIVSAMTAGLIACKGEITPVWLSEDGQPLKLGRDARYATPGQWKALVARDQHCSFPGCTVPPQWCDSHHITWWCRGGETDVDDMALLCGQHHTFVHLNDLTATVSGGSVLWHV